MKLGVNIDHIATIRQARRTPYPSIVAAAAAAESGGADFITAHLREDRRHIIDGDLAALQKNIATWLNLEVAATAEMADIALATSPRSVCVVPEKRAELTTEGGLQVCGAEKKLAKFCAPLIAAGMEVSLFVNPDCRQLDAAGDTGAAAVELHTGQYAADGDIAPIAKAAEYARRRGLKVNAGHGLRADNLAAVLSLDGIAELNIGHAIVARALFIGLTAAVREIADKIAAAR